MADFDYKKMRDYVSADPEITKEHAETACARAIEAHENEKKLEATFNG